MLDTQTKQFAVLVLGLSTPFYVLGALGADGEEVVALPLSALSVVVPAAAAVIVTRRSRGSVAELLARGVRRPRARPWLWTAVGLGAMPALVLASHALGSPRDVDPTVVTLGAVAGFVAMALVGSYGEEVGWAAFASRRLLARHRVLATGVLVGLLWGVWHFIPFVQTNHSWSWIWWQTAFTVAFRVLITAVYALSGRSALIAVLMHASYNVVWSLLPNVWSSYDPAVLAPVTAVAGIVAAVAADRRAVRTRVPV